MNLIAGKMRPGIVAGVGEGGEIKAYVPGLFSEEDTPDKLPPIYPFNTGNSNMFSSVGVDDEVWVLFFDDNPLELFWIRKDDRSDGKKEAMKGEDVEILCIRETIGGDAKLYFNTEDGWNMWWGESRIKIEGNGDICISREGEEGRDIRIEEGGIYIGGRDEQAVLGNQLMDCLKKLNSLLISMENTASMSPFTALLATTMKEKRPLFETSLMNILSDDVKLG